MNAAAELMLQNALVAALFALLVAVGSRIWRRPAVTHLLWLLVLLKLLAPPLVTIPIRPLRATDPAQPAPGHAGETARLVVISAGELTLADRPPETEPAWQEPEQAFVPAVPWLAWCLGTSLAGSAAYFLVLGIRVRQFAGLLGEARAAPPSIAARAARLCKSIGLRRCPVIRYVPGQIPPTVWGWGVKPCILVPARLFERLEAGAQDALLVHELAHVRRRDHWVRFVEILVTGLYWWNPVVWLARRELREAEEQCCDRYVLRAFPGASRTYAGVLVDTVDFLSGARFAVPPAASAAGPTRCLRRRIEMVMCGTDFRSWSWMSRLAVAAATMLLLPLGATWADGPEKGDKGQTKQKVVVLQADSGAVLGEGVLVVTVPDADTKAPAAGEKGKAEKAPAHVITVITKAETGEKTEPVHVPLNVLHDVKGVLGFAFAKVENRTLKGTGRPKSVTIAYEDGAKETIELGDCDLLTLDVQAGTVSLVQRQKSVVAVTKSAHVPKALGELVLQNIPGATKSHVMTGKVVMEHKADVKKDGGVEGRLERLEQTLLKLQQEIKALKKE